MNPELQLGPYQVVKLIGSGGMGKVYEARDTRLGRTVAIKVISGEFNDRLIREARAAGALNHPHICTLYDIGPNYLVMEYVDGAPLRGPITVEAAREYALQIVDALDAAHRKGIVHRDLKPENILLTESGIKLLDFGLAKLVASDLEAETQPPLGVTAPGTLLGSYSYMSPEQAEGQPVDGRSDIFSFGVVLYELLGGRLPFGGDTRAGKLAALLRDEPRPFKDVRHDIPESLEQVVARCLQKRAGDRFQTATELKSALIKANWGDTPSAPAPASGRRVILIEDDPEIRGIVRALLATEGFQVEEFANGRSALERVFLTKPDLILVDLRLPGLDGAEICKRVRAARMDTPMIVISAAKEEVDRVLLLELGADDFLVKPFGARELLARIKAVLRRSAPERTILSFANIEVDTDRRLVTRQNVEVPLSPSEYNLLTYFLRNPNQVLTREKILEGVWGFESAPTARTVDSHVVRLRQKLEPDPSVPRYFLTVHGAGYRFVA